MTKSKRVIYTLLTVCCILALIGAIISLFFSRLFLLSAILWAIGMVDFTYIGFKINPYKERSKVATVIAIACERHFMVPDAIMLAITFFLLLASLISWDTRRDDRFADMTIGSVIVEEVEENDKVQGTLQVTYA